jgi:3-oxoacyl-[acyl-carrier protein] reductase
MLDIDLSGKVTLISGGSRGIGRATALQFASVGARVSIGYRCNEDAATETLSAIRALGADAIATKADITTAEGCAELYRATAESLGKVDILINNAGFHENDVFMMLKDESFERLYAAHVMSVVRMCRLVATDMLTRRWGRIINISSVAATKPTVGQPNYAAAKAGVEAITRCLAIEMHKRGINVNCVSLGLIETDMIKGTNAPFVLSHQLVKRLGQPDEVAAWILMLASRYGDYVTGRTFDLDGGFMLI